MSEAVIACSAVRVCFDQYVALNNVDLHIGKGQTVALIGPNGAGKTTLLNALSGRLPLASGHVLMRGEDVTRLPVHLRVKRGLGRSFQIINIFQEMTTFENLRLAAQPLLFSYQPFWRDVSAWPTLRKHAEEVAELVGLSGSLDVPVASLSHGRQRAVELGLALMSDPEVLLLDEPLAGVGQAELHDTVEMIERVRRGRTVLLVEHNMDAVMRLADEIVVMIAGEVLMRGTPDQVRSDERVRRAYLGTEETGNA